VVTLNGRRTSTLLNVRRVLRSLRTTYGPTRIVFISPRAQDVLRPYLLRGKTAFCFVPAESERKRQVIRREHRVTPMTPFQAKRRRKRHPKWSPGACYVNDSYRRAITDAIDQVNAKRKREAQKAGQPLADGDLIPHWTPNQLRHTAATEIRKAFGLESVQAVLGHAHMKVSEVYAEKNLALAAEVMQRIG